MTDVTDADREKAMQIMAWDPLTYEGLAGAVERGGDADDRDSLEMVDAIAAALAEERAKARAPFLTAADKLDERAAAIFDDKRLRDEITTDEDEIIADAFHHCADRIRRASEESQ